MKELFKSKRLHLRALELSDVDCIYKWENNTADWDNSSNMVPYSYFQVESYIKNNNSNLLVDLEVRFLVETHEGEKVGTVDLCNFDEQNSRAYIGVYIDEQYRRKGYATEACQLLVEYARDFVCLNQLVAEVVITNTASMALFKRLGFEQTAILPQWYKSNGEYRNIYVFQMLFNK